MRNSFKELVNETVGTGATKTSDTVNIENEFGFSVYAKWTAGASTGTIAIQASTDAVNFIEVADTSSAITGTNDYMRNVTNAYYKYFRVVVVSTLGAIPAVVQYNGKGV